MHTATTRTHTRSALDHERKRDSHAGPRTGGHPPGPGTPPPGPHSPPETTPQHHHPQPPTQIPPGGRGSKSLVTGVRTGARVHLAWERLEQTDDGVWMVERLAWFSFGGERWIEERRTIRVHPVTDDDELLLTVVTEMTPAQGAGAMTFGSPTTNGRPMAGYSGLTLRMQRSMNQGKIATSTGQTGPEVMGQRAAWLHYAGRTDTTNQPVCVAMFDHPENPRHPTKFFVRNEPFGCISPAFCFDEEYVLEPGQTLSLRYGVWVRRGEEDLGRVEAVYGQWVKG